MADEQDVDAGAKPGEEPKAGAAPRPAPAPRPKAPGAAPSTVPGAVEQEKIFEGYLAEVVEVVHGRTGIYGEIKQAMCKIMEGKDRGRVIRRNVAGKIKKGDIIRLPDTSREDKKIMAR